MALDISGSSIGLDKQGIKKVKDDIELNLIDESIKVIKNDVNLLKNNIPNYWVGAAGKAFALKCESERSKVCTILKVLKAKVQIDLGTMAANTVLADSQVATAIWGLNGGIGGGSSTGGSPIGGGNTPAPAPAIPDPDTEPPQNLEEDPTSTPEKDNQEAEDIDVDGNGETGESNPGGTNGPIVPGEEPPKEDPKPEPQPEPQPEEKPEEEKPEEEKPEEEKPEDESQQEQPTPPTEPVGPTIGGDAGDGSEQPAEPQQPTEPTEPAEPTEPVEPQQPETPAPTGNEISGNHSPGTTDTTYPAQPYALDKNSVEYRELVATIYAEASEDPNWIVSDTMGVCSTILNRVEAGNWGGSTIHDVVSAGGGAGQGQFHGYGAGNRKFDLAMANINNVPAAMLEAIDRVLAGERNTTGYSFWGDGEKTHFR